ncbi:MAG: aldose epimerase family protein [Bacteroidota bacterium]
MPSNTTPALTTAPFGQLSSGEAVVLYTLTNATGMQVQITNYGGIVTSIRVPDREGILGEVTLGYETLEGYLDQSPYFGALIGRYGNRIGEGRFTLDGETYTLATNNGPNHLHGGMRGFDKVVWAAEPFEQDDRVGLVLRYTSPDGEEGYPGTLDVRVTYTLTNDNTLDIAYHATTDAPTPVNLTNHAYFNLKDGGATPVLDHELMLQADAFVPVTSALIPTGELQSVERTPFDFRTATPIGARIDAGHEQIRRGNGYDHTFVLDATGSFQEVATVHEPTTGRVMTVFTEEPGVQLYSGNFLDGSITGRGGRVYQKRHGFCLETQHFPDSPNQPHFPSVTLRPGEVYETRTAYRFSVR